jgi:poly(A) polymerase
LYYCIKNSTILDLTGGVNDIQNKTLRIIGDPSLRFQEDPVRMLRAIRFSAKLQFSIAEETAKPMYELHHLITHMSASRLFDEIVKMYQCGAAKKVQELLLQYHLFAPLFPQTNKLWQEKYPLQALLQVTLENTDSRIQDNKPVTPAFLFAALLWFPLKAHMEQLQEEGIPALVALEQAMSLVIHEQNKATAIPKRISVIMREIWLLQFRFSRRLGNRAFHLLEHPRFRAAYDFLAVRALAADAPMELADWWTRFQEEDLEAQEEMVQLLQEQSIANKKRKQAS